MLENPRDCLKMWVQSSALSACAPVPVVVAAPPPPEPGSGCTRIEVNLECCASVAIHLQPHFMADLSACEIHSLHEAQLSAKHLAKPSLDRFLETLRSALVPAVPNTFGMSEKNGRVTIVCAKVSSLSISETAMHHLANSNHAHDTRPIESICTYSRSDPDWPGSRPPT